MFFVVLFGLRNQIQKHFITQRTMRSFLYRLLAIYSCFLSAMDETDA